MKKSLKKKGCIPAADDVVRRPSPANPFTLGMSQVRQLLHTKIKEMYLLPQFAADVMKPLNVDPLLDQEVQNLSGAPLCCGVLCYAVRSTTWVPHFMQLSEHVGCKQSR